MGCLATNHRCVESGVLPIPSERFDFFAAGAPCPPHRRSAPATPDPLPTDDGFRAIGGSNFPGILYAKLETRGGGTPSVCKCGFSCGRERHALADFETLQAYRDHIASCGLVIEECSDWSPSITGEYEALPGWESIGGRVVAAYAQYEGVCECDENRQNYIWNGTHFTSRLKFRLANVCPDGTRYRLSINVATKPQNTVGLTQIPVQYATFTRYLTVPTRQWNPEKPYAEADWIEIPVPPLGHASSIGEPACAPKLNELMAAAYKACAENCEKEFGHGGGNEQAMAHCMGNCELSREAAEWGMRGTFVSLTPDSGGASPASAPMMAATTPMVTQTFAPPPEDAATAATATAAEMPSLWEQGGNFAKAAGSELLARLKGKPPISRRVLRYHRKICEACPHRIDGRCSKCGCFLKAKTSWRTSFCPEGKW